MSIEAYCQRELCSVQPSATLREAAERMLEAGVGCVLVLEDGRPSGLLTDRDLALRVLCDRLDAGAVRVAELGLSPPVTLRGDHPLGEAVRFLRRRRFRRLPVVDGEGRVIGILPADDMLRVVVGELAGLAAAVQAQSRGAKVPTP